jgi:hypothetical protein
MKTDPDLWKAVKGIDSRRALANTIMWGVLIGGGTLFIVSTISYAYIALNSGEGPEGEWATLFEALMVGGLGLMGLGGYIGLIIAPDLDDLIPVVKKYNRRHPKDPVQIYLCGHPTGGMMLASLKF